MALVDKVEAQAEIKYSPDKFYGFFKNSMSSFVQIFPQIFKSFEVVGGGEVTAGSLTQWKYDFGGGLLTAKVKIEAADVENTSITFDVLEGDLLKLYKSFKAKLEAVKADNGGSIVKWTLEFEKANANAPEPKDYADKAIEVSKGIDAYLSLLPGLNSI